MTVHDSTQRGHVQPGAHIRPPPENAALAPVPAAIVRERRQAHQGGQSLGGQAAQLRQAGQRRLREAGKESKVALIALARKLLTIANAVVRSDRPYTASALVGG